MKGGLVSFPHTAGLPVSVVRKIRKLIHKRNAAVRKARRLNKRIRKMTREAYALVKKRKYQKRITIVSKKIKSADGRFDVKFENPVVSKLTGMCFQVLRFVPKALKLKLQKNGQWDDVAQTLYTTAIEFFRSKNGNLTTEISPSDYKELVNLANRNVRRTICDIVAGFGHKKSEKYVSTDQLNEVPVSSDGAVPFYVHEKTLRSSERDRAD